MRNRILLSCARIAGALALFSFGLWIVLAQPTWGTRPASTATVDPQRLEAHVRMLSEHCYPRDWTHTQNLDRSAAYIRTEFEKAGGRVEEQPFDVDGKTYRNVIAHFGPERGARLIVGAHYDACGDTPGADDNASGVAALIEIAHLLGSAELKRPVELVAYTLEEPPFFKTRHMGSAVHVARSKANGTEIHGVLILEMVGYFTDAFMSQSYPSGLLYLCYPSRGNFLAVVGKWDQGVWIKSVKQGMKGRTTLPIRSIRAPSSLPGIDYSDHLNYWAEGHQAVMLTDTAFYRNERYHTRQDTPDTLDYLRMRDVVIATFEAVREL